MIKIIYQKSVKDLGEKIANKKDAVPAGGTTSALNGYLAVSLLKLVFEVSIKNFSKEEIKRIKKTLTNSEKDFLKLMEEDITAFKMNSKSNFKDNNKLKKLIEVPLEIVKIASEILKLTELFKNNIKSSVKADYDIVLENLKTAKKGAITIIESNYQFFADYSQVVKKAKEKIRKLK